MKMMLLDDFLKILNQHSGIEIEDRFNDGRVITYRFDPKIFDMGIASFPVEGKITILKTKGEFVIYTAWGLRFLQINDSHHFSLTLVKRQEIV